MAPIFEAEDNRDYSRLFDQRVNTTGIASKQGLKYLWMVLLTWACIGIGIVIFMPFPAYALGSAIILDPQSSNDYETSSPVAIFILSEHLSSVRKDQKVLLWIRGRESLERTVLSVSSKSLSPDQVQDLFNLPADIVSSLPQPTAVVITSLEPLPADFPPPTSFEGGVYYAAVEVERNRLISLIPAIGFLFN